MAKIYAKTTEKEIKREKRRAYYEANKDKIAAYAKSYHKRRMQKLKKSPKQIAEYRAKQAEYARKWREKNQEHNREYQRNYQREYMKDPVKKEIHGARKWRENNPEKYQESLDRHNELYHKKMAILNDFREGQSCAFCGNPKNLSVAAIDKRDISQLFTRAEHFALVVSVVRSTDIAKMNLQMVEKFFAAGMNLKCICSKCMKNVEA